ncbi:hypothetical protein GCM10017690_19170 [Microbacterium terregens]
MPPTWSVTGVSAYYFVFPNVQFGPYALSFVGSLTRNDGQPISEPGSVLIQTDAGDSITGAYTPVGLYVPSAFSASIHKLRAPNGAKTFTVTIEGEMHGPFPISQSRV